jgi:hypothetical protein
VVFDPRDLVPHLGGVRLHRHAFRHPDARGSGTRKIPGQADSAPANFRPLKVILRATVLSLVVCALVVLNYKEGWVTRQDLDVFGEPEGFSTGVG